MCGIVGFFGKQKIVSDILNGLISLQHRGQDSAGIVTFDKNFRMKKGLGTVANVFKDKNLSRLSGNIGIGHVRYTTQGSNELTNAQPFAVNYPFGLAMVHNGNVLNFKELRKTLYEENHRLLETSNDLELILYTFASELEKKDLKNLKVDDIFDCVKFTQEKVIGAYSTITIIANRGFLVFNDPYGIRPIVMGVKKEDNNVTYGFASESTTFDYLGYEVIENIGAGEAIFIDNDFNVHRRTTCKKGKAFCIFEYIYFSKEDSIIFKKNVASERVKMGKLLFNSIKKAGIEPDIIIDVPSSAYFFASGLSEEIGIPYRRGLAKNNHVGRSFISATQKLRESIVKQKLNPIKDIIKNKNVAVIDDSIVRGTTSKRIVNLLKKAGAKKIYFISAAPPIKYPCVYGIDMSIGTELIAKNYNNEEISEFIEADKLIYQSLDDLRKLYKDFNMCDACFSGIYPTGKIDNFIKEIEEERIKLKKEYTK